MCPAQRSPQAQVLAVPDTPACACGQSCCPAGLRLAAIQRSTWQSRCWLIQPTTSVSTTMKRDPSMIMKITFIKRASRGRLARQEDLHYFINLRALVPTEEQYRVRFAHSCRVRHQG